jgi:ABC-type antimicrobial peptide transport system permease subunit
VGLFLRQMAWLVGAGMVLGGAFAVLTTRTMEGLLYGVGPTDPTVFVSSAVALAVVALLGTWIPARRAARIDPVEALRGE